MNVILHKQLSFPHIATNIRTAPSKKMHMLTKTCTQRWYISFIPRNAIAHCYKQTVTISLIKQSSHRKKVIYLDFNLADTKLIWIKNTCNSIVEYLRSYRIHWPQMFCLYLIDWIYPNKIRQKISLAPSDKDVKSQMFQSTKVMCTVKFENVTSDEFNALQMF